MTSKQAAWRVACAGLLLLSPHIGDFSPALRSTRDAQVENLAGLQVIAEAAERTRRDEALLTERVVLARAHGRSWNRTAAALSVLARLPASGSAAR